VPAYLREDTYGLIKSRVDRVEVHHAMLTDFLKKQDAGSLHRYVLLDSQDWMSPAQCSSLWAEIDRTADPKDARVIFRTAGPDSPLPSKLKPGLLDPWQYLEAESKAFHAQDRSSIYGGFHLYVRKG
jgi:S-adenosylmethionine-diacylglycerol 3-amino-3-carboxypropyl transferase